MATGDTHHTQAIMHPNEINNAAYLMSWLAFGVEMNSDLWQGIKQSLPSNPTMSDIAANVSDHIWRRAGKPNKDDFRLEDRRAYCIIIGDRFMSEPPHIRLNMSEEEYLFM